MRWIRTPVARSASAPLNHCEVQVNATSQRRSWYSFVVPAVQLYQACLRCRYLSISPLSKWSGPVDDSRLP